MLLNQLLFILCFKKENKSSQVVAHAMLNSLRTRFVVGSIREMDAPMIPIPVQKLQLEKKFVTASRSCLESR